MAVALLAAKAEELQTELAKWSPRDHHGHVLKAQVGTLHAELVKAEAVGADHRANFAVERSQCDALIAELIKADADLMAAKGKANLRRRERGVGGGRWQGDPGKTSGKNKGLT